MSSFCTGCGALRNRADAFCQECGRSHAPAATTATSAPAASAQPPQRRRRAPILWISAGVLLLIGAGGAVAYALLPPSPTPERLLAAATKQLGADFDRFAKQNLCFQGPTDYRRNPVEIEQYNYTSRKWMDALASAGLFTAGAPVTTRAWFQTTAYPYAPTPALAEWLSDRRLCVAKGVRFAAATDIRSLSTAAGRPPRASATLAVAATGVAPWLAKPEIRDGVQLDAGWAYHDGVPERTIHEVFELRDGEWRLLRDQERRDADPAEEARGSEHGDDPLSRITRALAALQKRDR